MCGDASAAAAFSGQRGGDYRRSLLGTGKNMSGELGEGAANEANNRRRCKISSSSFSVKITTIRKRRGDGGLLSGTLLNYCFA